MTTQQSSFVNNVLALASNPNEAQERAVELLGQVGIPGRKSEAYKYTNISSILDKKVDLNLTVASPEIEKYKAEGTHLVVRNGTWDEKASVITGDVTVATREVTEGKHDPLSLINTILAPQEILITTSQEQSQPIFIYQETSNGLSNPRVKIVAEKNQEIDIVEKLFAEEGTFTNSYLAFEVHENASVRHTKVQQYGSTVNAHETLVASLKDNSRFYSNIYSFSGDTIRNNVTINIDGQNAEGHMNGLYLLDGKTHVDNSTSVDHLQPNSYSNELYKGILDEKSTGVFNGKIYVRPDAQKTNAFQSNNNILLSDDATINTKPQLEIWADDVKCSHGCTTGQLDEDAIFYLRARGINEKSAKAMILHAFASDTLSEVRVDELVEEVESLISEKLH